MPKRFIYQKPNQITVCYGQICQIFFGKSDHYIVSTAYEKLNMQ